MVMQFKRWLLEGVRDSIKIVSHDSMGNITLDVNGIRYKYITYDGNLVNNLAREGRFKPGTVLQKLKLANFPFVKLP